MDYINEKFALTVFPNHLKTVLETYIAMRDYVAKLVPMTITIDQAVYLRFICDEDRTDEDFEDFAEWTIHDSLESGVEHVNKIIQDDVVSHIGHWILDNPFGYGLTVTMPDCSTDLPGEMDVEDVDLIITPWYPETNS